MYVALIPIVAVLVCALLGLVLVVHACVHDVRSILHMRRHVYVRSTMPYSAIPDPKAYALRLYYYGH